LTIGQAIGCFDVSSLKLRRVGGKMEFRWGSDWGFTFKSGRATSSNRRDVGINRSMHEGDENINSLFPDKVEDAFVVCPQPFILS
jgi:hypothetical protein